MNKTELIAACAESTGMSKKDSERALNAMIDSITAALVKGEKVQISGFGIFETKDRGLASAATPTPRRPSRFPRPGCPVSRPARL